MESSTRAPSHGHALAVSDAVSSKSPSGPAPVEQRQRVKSRKISEDVAVVTQRDDPSQLPVPPARRITGKRCSNLSIKAAKVGMAIIDIAADAKDGPTTACTDPVELNQKPDIQDHADCFSACTITDRPRVMITVKRPEQPTDVRSEDRKRRRPG